MILHPATESIKLGDKEYKQLSEFIMSRYGIKLPPAKKTLLQCRLQKRLKSLHHNSFKEYVDYLFSSNESHDEISRMIDAVSTNKTDFFREPAHFDFLSNGAVEEYLDKTKKNRLNIWSAGCSSGEEPYTLAIVLSELIEKGLDFDFRILATDISENVLNKAVNGIYHEDKTHIIPIELKRKYLLKGKNEYKNRVKISKDIQSRIDFRKFNLLSPEFSVLGSFDIIFCRNVMIYFDQNVQKRLLTQFCHVLNKDGYLFIGHSESITGFTLPLQHIRPTIFRKDPALIHRNT